MAGTKGRIFAAMLAAALMFFSIAPACAGTRALNLVFIGGDNDREFSDHNVFRIAVETDPVLAEAGTASFVPSVNGDYSNASAKKQAAVAESRLSEKTGALGVVGGYSHGGQSVWFLDTEKVEEIFLFDGCCFIGGICNNDTTCGAVWADWVISHAREGVNIHVYASRGDRDVPTGTKNVIMNIEARAAAEDLIEALEDGWFQVYGEEHKAAGKIETAVIEGNHRNMCAHAQERVTEYLLKLAEEPVPAEGEELLLTVVE